MGKAVLALGKKQQTLLRRVLRHALVGGKASEEESFESSGGHFETEAFLGRGMVETVFIGLCCVGTRKAPVLGAVRFSVMYSPAVFPRPSLTRFLVVF